MHTSPTTADNATILIAEDNMGHAALIKRNLKRAGLTNPIRHFTDGQAILDYLATLESGDPSTGDRYMVVLDIQMPKIGGIEVLEHIKNDPRLRTLPVTMLTTTDSVDEVQRCHELGCNNYVTKPVGYEAFTDTIQKLGSFLQILQLPTLPDVAQTATA